MSSQFEKCEALKQLHDASEAWVIPNPWDAGSAKMLESLGFKALATTSAGYAVTLGRHDGEITLEEKLQHCKAIADATNVPVSVDFENGFSDNPETTAQNVIALAETGVAGCSIEDFGRDSKSIYEFNLAVDKIQASVEAIKTLGLPFQLCARAENLLRGANDMDDTIKRLKAFEEAGADILYAPGLNSLEQITQVKDALTRPINVLAPFFPGHSVAELGDAGATRISLGSALSNAALKPLLDASDEMLNEGTFSWVVNAPSGGQIARLLNR